MIDVSNIYYISEKPFQSNHAGSKARIDIDSILEQNKFNSYETFNQFIVSSKLKKCLKIISFNYLKKYGN